MAPASRDLKTSREGDMTWLDRFWAEQEVMYDWKSELARTGDRSEYVEKSD